MTKKKRTRRKSDSERRKEYEQSHRSLFKEEPNWTEVAVPYVYHHPKVKNATNERGARRVRLTDMPPILARLITQFAITHPDLKFSPNAYLNCSNASRDFIRHMLINELSCHYLSFSTNDRTTHELQEFYGKPSPQHTYRGPSDHAVTIIEYPCPGYPTTWYVDWTARQYNPKAPFPLIWVEDEP